MKNLSLWIVTMMISTTSILFGDEPESPAPEEAPAPGFEVTETKVKMPGVSINRANQEVRIDAEVCLQKGILEYVVCKPNTYEHEAIFTTDAKPELVHAALLLCGLKPTPQLRGMGDLWWEKAMKQKQSRVTIEVEWEQDGKLKRVNLTSMLQNRQDITPAPSAIGKDLPETEAEVQDAWIFSGSFLQTHTETGKRFYAANNTGILVGIWPNPSTIIQYGLQSGDPHQGKHLGLEINEDRVPEVGTAVKLVFTKQDVPVEETAHEE